jgi:fluoride exporter
MNIFVYKLALIGLGGFAGSVVRALVGHLVQERANSRFPLGTVAVNLSGCFIIGLLSYLADERGLFSAEVRAFVFVGVLGGFTTFSAFGNETFAMFRHGENAFALINVAVQVILGLVLVWVGRIAAEAVWR